MDYREWLTKLAVGDEVAVRRGPNQLKYRITKVTGRKGGGIQTENGNFGRDGQKKESGFWKDTLVPLTDEVRESIKRTEITDFLHRVDWRSSKFSLEALEQIQSIVKDNLGKA